MAIFTSVHSRYLPAPKADCHQAPRPIFIGHEGRYFRPQRWYFPSTKPIRLDHKAATFRQQGPVQLSVRKKKDCLCVVLYIVVTTSRHKKWQEIYFRISASCTVVNIISSECVKADKNTLIEHTCIVWQHGPMQDNETKIEPALKNGYL